jgi:hypothetical protein
MLNIPFLGLVSMNSKIILGALLSAVLVIAITSGAAVYADDDHEKKFKKGKWLVAETVNLQGLGTGKLFPILDTTPNEIVRAHVVLTDDAVCDGDDANQPDNIVVIVGQAGVALSTPALENTGIGGSGNQCIFHLTVLPGEDGIPSTVTDIVVLNNGAGSLFPRNSISVSAEVSPVK